MPGFATPMVAISIHTAWEIPHFTVQAQTSLSTLRVHSPLSPNLKLIPLVPCLRSTVSLFKMAMSSPKLAPMSPASLVNPSHNLSVRPRRLHLATPFDRDGGLSGMGSALAQGMVLVLSLWDDDYASMLWIDSEYPTNETASTLGVARGSCSTS